MSAGLTYLIHKIQTEQPQNLEQCGPIGRLMTRLSHVVVGGEGMTPEIAERYTKRISNAMERGKPEALNEAVAALLAAGIRLDPDPAQWIGNLLMAQLNDSVGMVSRALLLRWLANLQAVLETAKEEWNSSKWPTASDTLAWVANTVAAGVLDVQDGHEPWTEVEQEPPVQLVEASTKASTESPV